MKEIKESDDSKIEKLSEMEIELKDLNTSLQNELM